MRTAVAASLSPLAPPSDHSVHRQCTIPTGKWCLSIQAKEKAVQTVLKLVQEDVSLHRVCIVSDNMSTLQRIQNLHPFQQVFNSDENKIHEDLASPTNRECNPTFTWCPSYSGIHSKELADVAAKEETTEKQEGVGHHHDAEKAAMQQATKQPPISHERLRRKRRKG